MMPSARLLPRREECGEGWACVHGKKLSNGRDVDFSLRNPEIILGDFMLPWGMVIGTLGFFCAWLIVVLLERFRLTRHIWNLPLFFVALAVLCGCVLGLLLAP